MQDVVMVEASSNVLSSLNLRPSSLAVAVTCSYTVACCSVTWMGLHLYS